MSATSPTFRSCMHELVFTYTTQLNKLPGIIMAQYTDVELIYGGTTELNTDIAICPEAPERGGRETA